ncbi:MAG: DNA ligase [Methanobacterium sp.]
MIEPMLSKLTRNGELHLIGDWISEPKYDGQRLIAVSNDGNISLWTRRHLQVAKKFPELIKDLKENINCQDWILDGELTVPGGLGNLIKRNVEDKFRINILSKKIPGTFHVFDVLCYDKENLIPKPLMERKKILLKNVHVSEHIKMVPFKTVTNETAIDYFQKNVKNGFEGAILKNIHSNYESGKRSGEWLKLKREDTVDVYVIGATKSDVIPFGALIMERNGEFFGKVGTGFSDQDRRDILQYLEENKYPQHVPLPPDVESELLIITKPLLAEIRVNELIKGRSPRAPVWVRFRLD